GGSRQRGAPDQVGTRRTVVIDDREEEIDEIAPRGIRYVGDQPGIEQNGAAMRRGEEIAGVQVGVHEAIIEQHLVERAQAAERRAPAYRLAALRHVNPLTLRPALLRADVA